jgi:hypothetical protein
VTSNAVFGFVGVILGSLTTSVLTVYRERLTTRREKVTRDEQYERDRKAARDTFQRDSILALQTAISDLIRAVYQELDRILAEFSQTRNWPARQWETPTATGWSDALPWLELSRARVFDGQLRSLATELRTVAGESIWSGSHAAAKQLSQGIEPLQTRFNQAMTNLLPPLLIPSPAAYACDVRPPGDTRVSAGSAIRSPASM